MDADLANGELSVSDLLRKSTQMLKGSSTSARLDAELMLAHCLGWKRPRLISDSNTLVHTQVAERFLGLLKERRSGRPVAHILGSREFWSMKLSVTKDTLIPRPETELLVECALKKLPEAQSQSILDLGTGTGAIALALAKERKSASVTATDFSEAAIAVAQYNARSYQLGRIDFRFGDWFGPVTGKKFDLVVSNPPYVADQEWMLRKYELGYEPSLAVRAGKDGLMALRKIIEQAPKHLKPGAWLMVEHGFRQGPAVVRLFQESGFTAIVTYRDLPGRPRVTEGQWPEDSVSLD